LLVLNALSGELISQTVMDNIDPTTGKDLQEKVNVLSMPVASPDVLSSDGRHVYMKSQAFTMEGKRTVIEALRSSNKQTGPDAHFFAPGGILDDTAFHRIQMLYGKTYTGGHRHNHTAPKYAPAGKMLVFDDKTAYGFSRMPHLHGWARFLEFHVYAAPKPNVIGKKGGASVVHIRGSAKAKPARMKRVKTLLKCTAVRYTWSQHDPPLFGRAMVLADKTLFVAGPPAMRNEATPDALARWKGERGGLLWALSAKNGKKLGEYKLESPPVLDGMATAYGRLYVAQANGEVVCYAPSK
jgi:hypothetical protein